MVELEGAEPRWNNSLYMSPGQAKLNNDLFNGDIKPKEYAKKSLLDAGAYGAGFATGLGIAAAPAAIASEASLLSGTNWGSLPIVSSFLTGLGTATGKKMAFGFGIDILSQMGSNLLVTDFDLTESFRRWNITSTVFSTVNPSSKIGNLAFNGVVTNFFNITKEGMQEFSPIDVLTGISAEIVFGYTVGQAGNGSIQRSLDLEKQLPGLYKKHFDSYISSENALYLYKNGSEAFFSKMNGELNILLDLHRNVRLGSAVSFSGISFGGQTGKNSVLKLDDNE